MNKDGSKSQRPQAPRCALARNTLSPMSSDEIKVAIAEARESRQVYMFYRADLLEAENKGLVAAGITKDFDFISKELYPSTNKK